MSKRIDKVNELIKRELSQIILREANFPKEILVTLTRVETTSDLKEAKVFVSVLPENQDQKIFQILNNQVFNLQQKLNKRLEMKQIPKIKFCQEKEVKKAARIEELLEEIKNKGQVAK